VNHASIRTTQIYDRRAEEEGTLDEVDPIDGSRNARRFAPRLKQSRTAAFDRRALCAPDSPQRRTRPAFGLHIFYCFVLYAVSSIRIRFIMELTEALMHST